MLNELAKEIHSNAKAKGFYDTQVNLGQVLALIHSEVSEALEELRHDGYISRIRYQCTQGANASSCKRCCGCEFGKPIGFATELADIIIRTLDLCGYLGIDISEAVRAKMAYNATRPHKHGKQF